MRTRHAKKLVSSGLGLIALTCVWLYLAPVGLGGSTTYVVTDGISMEPRFHAGDLVLARSQSSYHVGEIVAYHSNVFHTIVLHRIVARVGGRYVFKGDNNNFVDFEHPAPSQLIGSMWLFIPGAGARLESLRSPALIGVLVGVGVLLFGGAAFTQRRRRRRRERGTAGSTPGPAGPWPQLAPGPLAGLLAIGLIALVPFLVLALVAFTRPSTASVPFKVGYRQSGTLSYSANATPGPAYAGNRAVTGDPLFTHVIGVVNLRFDYLFHTDVAHSLTGRASLDATVTATSGWHRTLQLARPTYFHGNRAFLEAKLDLTSLMALLHRVEATTAVNGSSYTLTVEPHVRTSGSLDVVPLHTIFSPPIKFSLNQLELQPAVSATGGSPADGQPSPTANPFAPTAAGSATGRHLQPLYLSLALTRVPVATARRIALGAIVVLAYLLLVAFNLARPRLRLRDESAAIHARYGHLIVPVAHVGELTGGAAVDVADFEALVRIAEHYDRSILHETTDAGEAYWVSDESGQYRYAIAAPAYTAYDNVVVEQPAPAGGVGDAYTEELRVEESAGTEEFGLGGFAGRGTPAHA